MVLQTVPPPITWATIIPASWKVSIHFSSLDPPPSPSAMMVILYFCYSSPPLWSSNVCISSLSSWWICLTNRAYRQHLKASTCITVLCPWSAGWFLRAPWSTAAPVSAFADGVWAALHVWGQLALVGLWEPTRLGSKPWVPHILHPNMHAIVVSSEDSEESRHNHVRGQVKIHMYFDVLYTCLIGQNKSWGWVQTGRDRCSRASEWIQRRFSLGS